MNASPPKSNSVSATAGMVCVASAILVAGHFLECSALLGGRSLCQAQVGAGPSAFDYAHSVPYKPSHSTQTTRNRAINTSSPTSGAAGHPWYRYALPLSTAVFLFTFSIWSLQSQPNLAMSSRLEVAKAEINRSISGECCDTPPTSVCRHAIEEPGLLHSGLGLDLSQ